MTLPNFNNERAFLNKFPHLKKKVQNWKKTRSEIERVFGIVLAKFQILSLPFKGRGMSITRLGQIITLAMMLTNMTLEYERKNSQRIKLVEK